jgi:hypothetical protein
MKIKLSNWWIFWIILFILISAALDSIFSNQFKCDIPLGKFIVYIGRCFFEAIAGIMGIFIGIGLIKKGRIKIHK